MNQGENEAGRFQNSSNSNKPFVWLHPPKNIELSPNDELFVLSDRNLMDTINPDEANGK